MTARTAPDASVRGLLPNRAFRGFLSGTPNFNSNYARRLLQLGRRDAEHVLDGLALSA